LISPLQVNCSQKSIEDTLPATLPTHVQYPSGLSIKHEHDTISLSFSLNCHRLDEPYSMFSSAGDGFLREKLPARNPTITDTIFDYLCRSIDNDYVAHPTDCQRYAYCSNGKKRDIQSAWIC
jgi:hypothetical protein